MVNGLKTCGEFNPISSSLNDAYTKTSLNRGSSVVYIVNCYDFIKDFPLIDIDLKKASKQFATHFSCGSSVTGDDEIVIQGDISDDLIDFLLEQWPDVSIAFKMCRYVYYI